MLIKVPILSIFLLSWLPDQKENNKYRNKMKSNIAHEHFADNFMLFYTHTLWDNMN